MEDAYVTLLMSDNYLPGVVVLAHSLRDAGTTKKLAVLITIETVSAATITELKNLYDYVLTVPRIGNSNPRNLYLMDRGDLLFTFTKINLWRQTQFRKIVYIDADVVALRAPDELFDIQASFAAAPDAGWPDAFNSGVMVLTPNMGEYWAMQTLAASGDSFDGADQGLLNQYYEHRPWQRISFTYNCTPNAEYQWEPAYKHYKANIKMVHFIGKSKPWMQGRHVKSSKGIYNELHSRWWAVYDRHMKQTQMYVPGQLLRASSSTISQHVKGEEYAAFDAFGGVPYDQQLPMPANTEIAPAMPHVHSSQSQPEFPPPRTEQQFSDPGERHENLDQGLVKPTPTEQARRFSAPHAEWDATRSAPPTGARPEAADFPRQEYTFSESRQLFQPPRSYPAPPQDMYYQVPKEPSTPRVMPKAIFPWEREANRPKTTRVFADDPTPEPERQPSPPQLLLSPTDGPDEELKLRRYSSEEPAIQPFAPQANAWDHSRGIDRYVRAVQDLQTRKPRSRNPTDDIMSPTGSGPATPARKESLIITDFPTFDDRPSLPVTPAPMRRPTFWGEERDDEGSLPAAEGVPDQADWNPTQKLDELRRSSVIEVEHLAALASGSSTSPTSTRLSQRDMPAHASLLASELEKIEEEGASAPTTTAELTGGATTRGAPIFEEPDFAPSARRVDTVHEEDVPEVRAPKPQRPAEMMRRQSPGSFTAESILLSEGLSPTER